MDIIERRYEEELEKYGISMKTHKSVLRIIRKHFFFFVAEDSTTMESPQRLLKAVALLNNIGCCLLRSRCYRQGLKTLSDALRFIQMFTQYEDFASIEFETNNMFGDIVNSVRAAELRLSHPETDAMEASVCPRIETLADDDVISKKTFQDQVSSVLCVVRMEPSHDVSIQRIEDLTTYISIVVYNLAIAYKCSATVSVETMGQQQYQQIALRLLKLGYCSISSDRDDSGENESILKDDRALMVAAIILEQLVQESPLGDPVEGLMYRNLLDEFRERVMQERLFMEIRGSSQNAAAA